MGHHHTRARPGPHDALDVIIAYGNRCGFDSETGRPLGRHGKNLLVCRDGFQISVIAGYLAHSVDSRLMTRWQPFPDESTVGPMLYVECLIYTPPRPEAWAGYYDADANIYNYVPVALVRQLVDSHGGIQRAHGSLPAKMRKHSATIMAAVSRQRETGGQ